MRYGTKKQYTVDLRVDQTPTDSYTIELSERDVSALRDLKSRNGAGMGSIPAENRAIWKMINQVCEK